MFPCLCGGYPVPVLQTHTRDSVLERVTYEYGALESAISELGGADWEQVLAKREGEDLWTVKDSLAHITYWNANLARRIRGQRRTSGEALPKSVKESNHVVYDEWKDRPLSDVLEWHRTVQVDLVQALRDAPDTLFSKRQRARTWPRAAVGHSVEHRLKDLEKPFAKEKP